MNKPDVFDHSFLKFFNLDKENIEEFHITHREKEVVILVKLTELPTKCPCCESDTRKIKDYRMKRINHSTLVNTKCTIEYKARRYQCRTCNKTYYEANPFVLKGMKMSMLTVFNVLDDLKSATDTFADVAKRHDISPTTVINTFDKYIKPNRLTLPRVLCIDEVYAFKSDTSNYVCVLVDFVNKTTIDILPSRKKQDLEAYFSSITLAERSNVELISIDMWSTYRALAATHFPNAKVAIDKFHVFQELTRVATHTRIAAMNAVTNSSKINFKELSTEDKAKYIKNDNAYYVFKKFNWLLTIKHNDELLHDNKKKKWNRKLQRYMNYADLLSLMLDSSSELKEVYNFQFMLRQFYDENLPGSNVANINMLIKRCKESNIEKLQKFGNTMMNWRKEIVNSLIIVAESNVKINNAIIENRNKVIKTIKRHSNGYSNWNRFRNRILYVTNPNATYSISG